MDRPRDTTTAPPPAALDDELAEVVRDVIAPLVARDDGTIELLAVVDGAAVIRLGGACAGCPGQPWTLSGVVLPALRAVDPRIRTVTVKSSG